MKNRTARRIIISMISIYLLGGLLVYLFQEQIIFHPEPLSPDHKFSFGEPYEEMNIPSVGNNISIVKFRPVSPRKGIVLFFHGNMENVERYANYCPLFLRNQYELWMIDYPGFGKSTGHLSEQDLYQQALIMFDLAAKEIAPDSIIIYGKSIGTGIASYTAATRKCKRLILETPYYSMLSLARHYFPVYPVSLMIHYRLPVNEYLAKLAAPITIFHGNDDEVVPYHESEKLLREIRSIELITIDKGAHNDLASFELFQQKIDALLR